MNKIIFKLLQASALYFSFLSLSSASEPMWPGAIYDPSIPTYQKILGYDVGDRITSYADMLSFFDALQYAAPENIKLIEYARSWEGRKLFIAVIGSKKNLANLDEYVQQMKQLSDPRITTEQTRKDLLKETPSSAWLQYAVHGNEISSTDAAMFSAYHLLATTNQPKNKAVLDNTLIFIDPLQNPDGRARFVSRYYSTRGLQESSDRLSAEHNEPWPNGRSNHYLFDLNRDWLAITQPETKGKIEQMNRYRPLVVADVHEMGGDESYYFAPPADPINPYMTNDQLDNINKLGRKNAEYFDEFGFDYFTREIFDAFYPGYGDSWPVYYGAIASTYEVASSRGEVYQRQDGELLTYWQTVQQHFVASISTMVNASQNREKLLQDYVNYQITAIEEGKDNDASRVFIMPNQKDKAATYRLAMLMVEHDVEVFQTEKAFKVCGVKYQAGSYYIDSAQPKGRFVSTTFEKQVDMDKVFLTEQERRRSHKLADEIYDVTGWSLPMMFNVETNACSDTVKVKSHQVKAEQTLKGQVVNSDAKVAYLVPWGDMAAGRFLTAALQAGIIVKSADKAFVLDGQQTFVAGTLIIEVKANSDVQKSNEKLSEKIGELALQTGAKVIGVDTSWVTKGPSFGSNNTVLMSSPKIAMAWGENVSSLSAGNSRFVIEQQFNYPVTAINAPVFATADLSAYQVIILPSGSYKEVLGEKGIKNITSWISRGGVLLTFGSATRFAADNGLLDVKRELAFRKEITKESEKEDNDVVAGKHYKSKTELVEATVNLEEKPDYVAGVLANIKVEQEHWLTAGVKENLVAMVTGNDIYTPIKLESGKNLAWFTGENNVLASGYLWQENKAQLAYKPYLMYQPIENGMVISFTQEPTARAYLDGLNIILMNTIFRSAAHATPKR
jgi:hypothetical protein